MSTPQRPAQVPPDAWWSEEDQEWILGPLDEQGRRHGQIRYWRPDGTLCCVNEHVEGRPHGPATRYHESGEISQTCTFVHGHFHGTRTFFATDKPTTEKMHAGGLSPRVWRAEFDCEDDEFVEMRFFDAQGTPLCRDGTPLPPRPKSVDARATFLGGVWISGRWTKDGKRNGLLRYFSRDGALNEETEWRNDVGEGFHRVYDEVTGELREEASYHEGLRDGRARSWRIDGTLAREATFSRGEYNGVLRDYDTTGTRVVREVRFVHGERQAPAVAPPPAPAPAPPADWHERLQDPTAQYVNLSHTGLERVPDEVRALPSLRGLDLSRNRLRRLPAWLVEVKHLAWLALARNRLPMPRTGRSVVAWLRRTPALPTVDRRVRFCLFMGDIEQARAEGDVSSMTRALDDPEPVIRAFAELALAGARPSPLTPGRRVHVVGVPRQRSRKALLQELQDKGLTVVNRIEDAEVLLVCGRAGALVSDERPLAVEPDLPVPPFDPRGLAQLHATAETHPDAAERSRARQQLRRQAPPAFWALLQGYNPRLGSMDEERLTGHLGILGSTGFLDRDVLAETIFQHSQRGTTFLIDAGGPRAKRAIGTLITKRTLDLELKGLRRVPPELGSFGDLAALKLGYNRLTTVPDELGDLFSLTELNLYPNPLTSLPDGIGRLTQLRRLSLGGAALSGLPESIASLSRLTYLHLANCGLKQVPESICRLPRLKDLLLGHNELTTLPESFAELQQLTYLHIPANPFGTLPPEILELRGLKTLWLESCKLRTLPPEIARLTQLELLCVWYNPLESLPIDALASLPRLRELRIRGNVPNAKLEAAVRDALPRCTIY
jgi:Leucine-rich repeat (LRR) protein/antitoxin component YwqK of YwqJK toxin-antitoxin module